MIPHNQVHLTEADENIVAGIVHFGQIAPGYHVQAFEYELAARFRPGGAAACLSSGSAALMAAMGTLGLKEAFLPTYSCVALYHAAVAAGIKHIRFLDCGAWSLGTPRATVGVHTYGSPIAILGPIEDFTHAPGVTRGRPCGSFGQASVISFGATKPLGCGGGGAVLGPKDLIEEIRDRRDYDGKREFRSRFNMEMSEFHAAIGRNRLRRLDAENAWRRETAAHYDHECIGRGIRLYGEELGSTFYRYVAYVPDFVTARAHFERAGIETICPLEPWELLHNQTGADGSYPNAEDAARHALSIPIWPGMSPEDVERVIDALKSLGEKRMKTA